MDNSKPQRSIQAQSQKLYQLYKECGGRVATDSRTVVGGELFFALGGDNFDGNAYALKALEGGALYAVVDDKSMAVGDNRLILVDDSLAALHSLAAYHREQLGLTIFALTGTNGKTTTKELIRVALKRHYTNVGSTVGNLNNHIGVPLTLLSFDETTEVGVVEMGANHRGEIAQLCSIVQPNYGLVTNVGRAHLDGFGSFEGVVEAKGEMYDYLDGSGGVALFNSDDAKLCEMIERREGLETIPYSGVQGIGKELKLFGTYNISNAAAALAVALLFDVPKSEAIDAIASYESTNNRSEVIELTERGNRVVVDCYNANPSSMESAIVDFLRDRPPTKSMILGSMRELGSYSQSEHQKLVELASVEGVKSLFVGEEFVGIAPAQCYYKDVEELIKAISKSPVVGSHILVKGSRGNKLEQVLPYL